MHRSLVLVLFDDVSSSRFNSRISCAGFPKFALLDSIFGTVLMLCFSHRGGLVGDSFPRCAVPHHISAQGDPDLLRDELQQMLGERTLSSFHGIDMEEMEVFK